MAYITDLQVSIDDDEEAILEGNDFKKIRVNINRYTKAKNNIYLWYKTGNEAPITRVQVTFNKEMETAMDKAEFTRIPKNLNSGTEGPKLYMWFSKARGVFDVPIVEVDVTDKPLSEVEKLRSKGWWEAVGCDLNLGVGTSFVYAWLKRERPIYIRDVTATDNYEHHRVLLSCGYTRVDVDTNLATCFGAKVFIWYCKTTDEKKSLSSVKISINDQEEKELESAGYDKVGVNLNKGTAGGPVFLWYKYVKGDLNQLRGMFLLRNMAAVDQYKEAKEIKVIEENLNTGNPGAKIYLCYVQNK